MVLDFNTLYSFPGRMDQVMEDFLRNDFFGSGRTAYPPLNISEDCDNIYVRCEIPGMDMKDVELTLTEKNLVIKGERVPQKGKYYRQERPAGVFQRIVGVNVAIDREKVRATMSDGILTVALPKVEECKPKTISIDVK